MPTVIQAHMGGFQISGARLSYPHLYEAKAVSSRGRQPPPGSRKSYSCQLILDPGTDTQALVAAMQAAANEAFPDGIPGNFNWPIWETSKKFPDQEELAGTIGLTCKRQENQGKPLTIDGAGAEITDQGKLYPGCRVGAFITVYAYNNVQQGVNCGLEMIMFQSDDEHLDGRLNQAQMMAGMVGGIPTAGGGAQPPQPEGAAPGPDLPGKTAGAPAGPAIPGQATGTTAAAPADNVVAMPGTTAPAAQNASAINPLTGKPYPV